MLCYQYTIIYVQRTCLNSFLNPSPMFSLDAPDLYQAIDLVTVAMKEGNIIYTCIKCRESKRKRPIRPCSHGIPLWTLAGPWKIIHYHLKTGFLTSWKKLWPKSLDEEYMSMVCDRNTAGLLEILYKKQVWQKSQLMLPMQLFDWMQN